MKSITIWLPLTFLGLTVLIALIKIGRKHEWFSKLSQNGLLLELDSYFEGRKRLTEEEFYIQYFEDQGVPKDIPIKVRKIF